MGRPLVSRVVVTEFGGVTGWYERFVANEFNNLVNGRLVVSHYLCFLVSEWHV